ncbi:hypothetical protein [Zoogloea sp.]|uniref:hypothetical protein n=1 Tax=Zoogloea sp. TaxID=49181 RepID=UPI0031FC2C52
MHIKRFLGALLLGSGMVGCASVAVTDDAIVQRTAFALALDSKDFTVSNRVDDGTTTRYQVRTRAGRQYNCFVGGSISVLGRTVSEAICTETGRDGAARPAATPGGCNALLKAAGKC